MVESGSDFHVLVWGGESWRGGEAGAGLSPGRYLATFTGDAAVVIPGGFVTAHHAELVLV